MLLVAGRAAGIPVVVTTCGTSGTDSGVDWVADIAQEIAEEEGLAFTMAKIYSELTRDGRRSRRSPAGASPRSSPPARSRPRPSSSCEHIVGLMGHEPITEALAAGADLVLAGRASDTASVAGIALGRGIAAGPDLARGEDSRMREPVHDRPDRRRRARRDRRRGFTVHPLTDTAAATPMTVAAHMLYENADPFRLREPGGTLDTSAAVYTALTDRVTRVEGSIFEEAEQATIKLEGAALGGYETVSLVGIRDPHVTRHMDAWLERFTGELARRVRLHLGLERGEYDAELRAYGHNAVLGPLEPGGEPPREVGVLFRARAADQATATAIAKIANPLMLHLPLEGMTHLPSFAFATSPAEIERGATYEFVLQHTIAVDDERELFRTEYQEVGSRG